MELDLIIPTYNRADLLAAAIHSVFDADEAEGLSFTVTVIDNNSSDSTAETVISLQSRYGNRLRYVLETTQGRAAALNRGINSTSAEFIGMIDDDEKLDRSWFRVVYSTFQRRPDLDFIGGPYLPIREIEFPAWLPGRAYRGVVGWIESGSEERYFNDEGGILLGGNAVLRRKLYESVGLYNVHLGRTRTRLMSMEDQDMYERFLAAGFKGLYVPRLIIYHYIPVSRLTKVYHRRWAFWTGVSLGIQERFKPAKVVKILGIPRYRIRKAVISIGGALAGLLDHRDPGASFASELDICMFTGMVIGIHFWKIDTKSPLSTQSAPSQKSDAKPMRAT